jgi:hypothetical protein
MSFFMRVSFGSVSCELYMRLWPDFRPENVNAL